MFRQVLRQSWNCVTSGGERNTQTKYTQWCGRSQPPVTSFNHLWIFQDVAAGGGQYWSSRRRGVIKSSRANLRGKACLFPLFFSQWNKTSYHGNETKETHLSACLSFCRTLLPLVLSTSTAGRCSSIYQPAQSHKHTHTKLQRLGPPAGIHRERQHQSWN